MSDHRTGVGATAGDPARWARTKTPCGAPRAQRGPRQCQRAPGADHDIRGRSSRGRNASSRICLRLVEERDRGAMALCPREPRGRQAVTGTRSTDGDEHRWRRHAGKQKLEATHLVSPRVIFPLEPQRVESHGMRETRPRLERCRPVAETARCEGGAYLCGQHCGAIHASSHRLHTSCSTSRPQIRGRSVRRSTSGSRPRILQDLSQGARRNRRGHGGAREGGVSAPLYIDTAPELAAFVTAARREQRAGVDTEAASFHRYRDRIYLLQISSPANTAVIDPVAIAAPGLEPFGRLLADPQVEKTFHDADYDLRVLDRDYGFRAVRLFDTRIAAQLAGEPAIGLAALLEKYIGVKLDKEHQKADWSLRPLTPSMLAYVVADTPFLLGLRDALEQQLGTVNRLSWAMEEFKQLESLRWSGPGGEEETYLRLKGAKGLSPRSLAALRLLHRWRDTVAERDDRAPFRIIGNDALLGVARALPATTADLAHIKDLPRSLARRYGDPL